MRYLREKFRSGKGFTLVEMLIVVAIIAILIAVSIPLVSGALEKARDATDQANERAAKAEAVLVYIGMDDSFTEAQQKRIREGKATLYYDAANGKLYDENDKPAITAYGKCTQEHPDEHLFMSVYGADGAYEDEGDHVNKIIMVEIDEDCEIRLVWLIPPKAGT